MSKFVEVSKDQRANVLENPNVVTQGISCPDGSYVAKVSKVGKFETKKGNVLLSFQGSLTNADGKAFEFEGKKFIVITDSLIWANMESGNSYDVEIENRRITSMGDKE